MFHLKVHPRHLLRDNGGGVFAFLRVFRACQRKKRVALSSAGCNRAGKERGEGKSMSLEYKEEYKEPDLEWLKKAFKDVKLGWLKASEMEVYLAYMLMYANNDLGRVAYEVADEYGYTESKVAKLQVEFARRFKKKEEDIAFLNRIFNAMINKNDPPYRIVPIVRKETISFTLYDAGDARKLRNIICRTGMMAISDSSKLVFNLTPEVFAALFVECSDVFKNRLEDNLPEDIVGEFKKLFPLPHEKVVEKVKCVGMWLAEKSLTSVIGVAIKAML